MIAEWWLRRKSGEWCTFCAVIWHHTNTLYNRKSSYHGQEGFVSVEPVQGRVAKKVKTDDFVRSFAVFRLVRGLLALVSSLNNYLWGLESSDPFLPNLFYRTKLIYKSLYTHTHTIQCQQWSATCLLDNNLLFKYSVVMIWNIMEARLDFGMRRCLNTRSHIKFI